MSLAERLIDQTFANAKVEANQTYSEMIVGTLKVLDREQVRAILLVDNGFAGKKLVALTTRALFIINNWGDVFAKHAIDDIIDVEIGFGSLTIKYELPAGGKMHHIYNLADSIGAYDLQNEFNDLRRRS